MNFKSEKGFTGVDITVALIVVLLFMSLIAVVFFEIEKSSKDIERESEATYLATNIIELFRSKKYDDVQLTGNDEEGNPRAILITEYKDGNNQLIIPVYTENDTNPSSSSVLIKTGYTVYVTVKNHVPIGRTNPSDLVKIVTIDVQYKLAGSVKNVELSTSIVREL